MANITSRPNANHPTIGDYSIGDAFDGNYGIVRIGSRLSTGERVVIKELDLSNSSQAKIEGDIMSKLKHPNIVELYDRFEQGNRLYLAMQYAEGGDLLEEISTSPNGMLPVASAKRIFVQLIQALEHMHKNNIVHLDVKPENVFLDANKNVLLGDFGLSSFYDPNSRSFDAVAGTVHYAAPEAYLESVIYGPELDVWSAGVVLYVMLRGRYPFWGETDNETATAILLAQPFWPEWFPEDAIDLLNKIFVKNQRKRITLSKIKRHPFVKAEFRALRASARLSASKALAPIVTAASLGLPKLTLTAVMSPRQRLVPQLAGVIGISPRFNPALVRPLSPTCASTTATTGSSLKPQAPLKHNGREEVMVA